MDERTTGRKTRVLRVAPSLLFHLIRVPDDRARITSAGLPDDVRLLGAYYDDQRAVFRLYVESATFDLVPEGEMPPELEVTFTRHEGRDAGA